MFQYISLLPLAPVLCPVVGVEDYGGAGHPGEEDSLNPPVPPAAATLHLPVHVEHGGPGHLPGHPGPGGPAQPAAAGILTKLVSHSHQAN